MLEDSIFKAMGCVARPISRKSEGGRSQKMLDAIEKERQNHASKGTWDYSGVSEYADVAMIEKGAEFVQPNLILVEKNSEDPNPLNRKCKARLAALGDKVIDAFGLFWTYGGRGGVIWLANYYGMLNGG